MKKHALLEGATDRVRSRVGGWLGTKAIFRGHDLHRDLKDMDWFELNVFGITNRRFSTNQLRVLQAIWTCTSYPDSRIWNNRVAALSGTTRSTGALGMAAAVAVSEARIYGLGPGLSAYDFFVKALDRTAEGLSLEVVVKEHLAISRGIGGYGRPLTSEDERIEPLMSLVRELGLDQGKHLQLAFRVDDVLREGRWRLKINYAALAAAISLDMGFSRQEFYLYVVHLFLAGMTPCYINASDEPEGTLLPLSCAHINYLGHEKRSWGDYKTGTK
ncbi:MAG: hypothetical protein RIS44_2819 [Pseudomonadota bacterium]|jgi:hypothetical protein